MAISELLSNIKAFSEIIQSLGIGIGAAFGAFGGLKVFLDWKTTKQKEDYLKGLKLKYPREGLNKDYIIVDTKAAPGRWYILDNRGTTRHWIENMETMQDLGLWAGEGKRVSQNTFKKYKESFSILTKRI